MDRAVFVGHSLIGTALPDMFDSFMAHQGSTIRADAQIINGAPLRYNWDNGHTAQGVNARAVLPSGDYGHVIVTEAIPLDAQIQWNDSQGYAKRYFDLGLSANANMRFYLYETWHDLGSDHAAWRAQIASDLPKWQGILDHVNNTAASGAPEAVMIPAGQAMGRLYDAIQAGQVPGVSSIQDLFADHIHLNDLGMWYVAAVHAATVTGVDAASLPLQTYDDFGGSYDAPGAATALAMAGVIEETLDDVFGTGGSGGGNGGGNGGGGNGGGGGGNGGNGEDNTLTGDENDNVLNGYAGNDSISGAAGDDLLIGGADNDTLDGGTGNDMILGHSGNDSILGGEGADTVFGGTGEDMIDLGWGNDSLLGQGGDDTLLGQAGNDTIRGGSGNDSINGGWDHDRLFGQGNDDTILGGDGNDLLQGSSGADHLYGEWGHDTLTGGAGSDRLDGGVGNDRMNGGRGDGARDYFVFMQGYDHDRIVAFAQSERASVSDVLELDWDLWGATHSWLDAQGVVNTFGTMSAGGTVLTLDFGGGDVLEIQNAGGINPWTLGADIQFI